MATNPLHVNKTSTRVEKPSVSINGKIIDETTGVVATIASDYNPNRNDIEEVVEGEGDFTNTEERIFYADGNDYLVITITPDPKFPTNSYGLAKNPSFDGNQLGPLTFQGEQQVVANALGLESETYYTLNGKNPKRTKTSLYTRPFNIRRNEEAGSDNLILKARTYRAGQWSEIRTVEFRIARKTDTKV